MLITRKRETDQAFLTSWYIGKQRLREKTSFAVRLVLLIIFSLILCSNRMVQTRERERIISLINKENKKTTALMIVQSGNKSTLTSLVLFSFFLPQCPFPLFLYVAVATDVEQPDAKEEKENRRRRRRKNSVRKHHGKPTTENGSCITRSLLASLEIVSYSVLEGSRV